MKLRLLKFLMLMFGLAIGSASWTFAQDVDPTSEDLQVTAVELDTEGEDYDELALDAKAVLLYEFTQTGGQMSDLTPEQQAAVKGYFQRYEVAPFFTISNLWILIAAALVFLMHLGFATLESGLSQSKNTVNVLFKNVFIICMGLISYLLVGFNSMYPVDAWIIKGVYALNGAVTMADYGGTFIEYGGTGLCMTGWTDFIFQAMFAATAATIVSGAVAERVKLPSFMIFATLLVSFAYPVTGSWKWGGGWLDGMGFYDFAGSSLVHAFGGFAALACVILLGARKGKYLENGKIKPILGHSMPLATIGVFLLFLGWFGFNGGSVLSADAELVSFVFVTTAMAAAAGGLAAIAVSWALLKKPDLSMALNGILAGLVGITAGADSVTLLGSVLIGLIAGALVVVSILFFDKIKIDDPVGAVSVHGICGVWGTLAVAIFQQEGAGFSFMTQLIGTLSISAFAFIFSIIFFGILKVTIGIRVSEEEEAEGLDIGEHGQEAYPQFAPDTK
ncbi:ammonium transporter [Cerasicoccus fimbriatus]|uniref:ammonium transporter n=1 Tax=Cerasicoccus fimbriatus TaxID=3014554 RepID=UPI0022B504A5|nr:ammonium transporter [Cerasicoccus sp. TK19100]